MIRLALVAWLALCGIAHAQLSGGVGGFPGPGTVHSSAAYTGPGDVVSGAFGWWGLRAYNLAQVGTKVANICNSGDANCADVNSLSNGDFDVATATGSPLSCGGAGGTCTVKILYDQTGANACGGSACDLNTSTSAATRPTLTFNCIGTKPCMTFNGSSQFLRSSGSVTAKAQPNTLSAVAQTTNTGANRHIIGHVSGAANQLGYPTTNNTAQVYAGSNVTATASAGSYHALQGVQNGASCDINVDGASSTGNCGTQDFSGQVFMGQIFSSQWMSGQVLEVGAWNIAFNGTQSSNMSSNQHSYWGF